MKRHPLKWTLLGMIFFSFIVVFRVVFGLLNYYLPDAEDYFFYISLILFFIEIFSIYSLYKYKKIGVYIFPLALFIEIFLYAVYGGYLIDNIVGLFWFIGFGMIYIAPIWDDLT